ncbi:DEAD/DEAH box helicase-like protein [Escherichia coli PA31]|nr:DEAD/DEAH box helicase-like protein [Escherichia coli PA31]
MGVMMYGPFDGKVKPAANQGIRLPALTNGSWVYAVSPG